LLCFFALKDTCKFHNNFTKKDLNNIINILDNKNNLKGYAMRKLRIFWRNHWVMVLIIFAVVVLIITCIWGLLSLESFYRNLTIATMPINMLFAIANAAIFVFLYMTVFSGGFSKLKKKKIKGSDISASNSAIKFSDIIGLEGAKKEAMEVVSLLKDRARVKKIGGKIIKGILLLGPPGCGKTLLAKAIATESRIPFISISGSEFVEVFVGVGASRMRKLFKQAREHAYESGACIIFIDELDVIGRGRTFSNFGSGEETNSTQNQLLVEMDGLEGSQFNVLVIGATNTQESTLDKALLRPGRFDRKLQVNLPNLKEREDIIKYYLKKVSYDQTSINTLRIAQKTVYKSPAEIENAIKEAALIAARKQKDKIDKDDIIEALDRIDLGLETHLTMTKEELEQTAYHEAGHAVALYYLHPTDDVFKASIKSRAGALGMVLHHPINEMHSANREKLLADIVVSVAGFAAEKIKYNTTTTGVSADLRHASTVAHTMVWTLGMSDDLVGDFTATPEVWLSESFKQKLNEKTNQIIKTSLAQVDEFLRKRWQIVETFAQELLLKGELDYEAMEQIFAKYSQQENMKRNIVQDLFSLEKKTDSDALKNAQNDNSEPQKTVVVSKETADKNPQDKTENIQKPAEEKQTQEKPQEKQVEEIKP